MSIQLHQLDTGVDVKIWLNIQDFLPQKLNGLLQNLSCNSAEFYFLQKIFHCLLKSMGPCDSNGKSLSFTLIISIDYNVR